MNDYKLIYTISLLVSAILFAVFAFMIFKIDKKNIDEFVLFTREKKIGTVLCLVSGIWGTYHTFPLISPDGLFAKSLIPAIFVVSFLVYKYLDFVFARFLAAFMILFAHYCAYRSFAYAVPPIAGFQTLLSYALGILGIYIAWRPYSMRDLFEKCSKKKNIKIITCSFFAVFALIQVISFVAIKSL